MNNVSCRCVCCRCCKCNRCCKCCVCVVHKECCENDCNDCKKCSEKPCFCDIIQSIALQEAALAHILNAEGEKIQRAVSIAGNVCELLMVNKSVIETINSVTQLELALVSKLNTIRKCKEGT